SASLSETQGLTFIEALACGLPLLCRRDPSLASVVIEGRTGWQYEDAEQFSAHLSALLDDPRRREEMATAAREHAQATCGAQDFGRHVLEVYRQSLRRRPARIISRPVVTACAPRPGLSRRSAPRRRARRPLPAASPSGRSPHPSPARARRRPLPPRS